MGAFDSLVLVVVGFGVVTGFLRGFVHEVLALLAWGAAVLAIRFLHPQVTDLLAGVIGTHAGAAVIAFALLLLVPFFLVRAIARWAGGVSRGSVLGPFDRVLGLGFGGLKGLVFVVLGFSLAMLGNDTVWGAAGRPGWITHARTYPIVNAASNEMVTLLAERRQAALAADAAGPDSSANTSASAAPATHPRRHARHRAR